MATKTETYSANSFVLKTLKFAEIMESELARESVSAVRVIDALLQEAHAIGASDIHLDPGAFYFTARFRVDGILHDAHQLPIRLHNEILARLKILAGLRID